MLPLLNPAMIRDFTSVVPIPPSKFELKFVPNTIKLVSGEDRDVQLHLSSNSNVKALIKFSFDKKFLNLTNKPTIFMEPVEIEPNGESISNSKLRNTSNILSGSYLLPITANIHFPVHTDFLKETWPSNPTYKQHFELPVNVEKSPTIIENGYNWIKNFLHDSDIAINFFAAIVGSFIGILVSKSVTSVRDRKVKKS